MVIGAMHPLSSVIFSPFLLQKKIYLKKSNFFSQFYIYITFLFYVFVLLLFNKNDYFISISSTKQIICLAGWSGVCLINAPSGKSDFCVLKPLLGKQQHEPPKVGGFGKRQKKLKFQILANLSLKIYLYKQELNQWECCLFVSQCVAKKGDVGKTGDTF